MKVDQKILVWIACDCFFLICCNEHHDFDCFQINRGAPLKGRQGQQSFQDPKLIVVMLLSALKRGGSSLTAQQADLQWSIAAEFLKNDDQWLSETYRATMLDEG